MEEQPNMVNVTVIWRGNKYMVEMDSNANLKELGDELQKLTDVKADTMSLIVPQFSGKGSRMLHPFSDEHSSLSLQEASIFTGKSVRMMGAPQDEVDRVIQYSKVDQRIIGFSEEERRLRQRMLDGPSRVSIRLPQGPYIFCDFRTLQLPGVELHPPASEALRRMHMLASDPGIIAVMNKHQWRVGIMTEMAPIGYVGVSPKCILGFNKNHGEEISLRLRTDDLKGFRKYESIKKTLLHELAHMVFSEHDSNFYALDKLLNEEAASLDWTKSRAHTLSGIRHSDNSEEDYYVENGRNSQKVGGNVSTLLENARASAVAAAYHRLINTSSNVEASKTHDESDPDDPVLDMHDGDENLDIQSQIRAQGKHAYEPDPDDLSDNQNKFEPDPDDLLRGETLQLKHHSDPAQNDSQTTLGKPEAMSSSEEPDLDDSGAFSSSENVVESVAMLIPDTKVQRSDIIDEPDPDDRDAQSKISGFANGGRHDPHHNITIETLKDQAHKEPGPDDAKANEIAEAEPHSDDRLLPPLGISDMKIDEPNLDDQELQRIQDSVTGVCSHLQNAIEMLRAEVNPTEATVVLQTLFKIIRHVLIKAGIIFFVGRNVIEHPDEKKFRRLRKANPIIQRNVANYKAAMEILLLIGFSEDVTLDETYIALKRNDPGLLWLAMSSLETYIAC
ncbi:putative lipid-A-disaccharide synthase [Hibiscus syriacus]|uniref:Lipid-A-disaccharide synthase n=1 Tax=Hibiscus syriacus TaxID=106335 RepID=A0A6A2Z2D8_HIBSY|nr:putative lipid-A-disaccharide synthase [Hibiscus syriacus]